MEDLKSKILVVDDDEHILLSLKVLLEPEFGEIITIGNPKAIPGIMKDYDFDLIILDMNYSQGETTGNEGIHWLREILNTNPDQNIVLITAYGDINIAVEALKYGAIDFIVKPWNNEKILASVKAILELSHNKREVKSLKQKQKAILTALDQDFPEMIGESVVMKELFETIEKVAKTDANILIQGENGTGKELVARALHKCSNRKENIFVNIDLGAITESLFESELFGHKKGAFTDAKEDKAGRFEAGSGGTIFLDEIGNLSLSLQAKLLSVIQNREVFPVGSSCSVNIDIRLICATNMNLSNMVNENLFRQDLLYRINTVEIEIPPLRDRKEDIPLIAKHYLEKYGKKYHRKVINLPEYVEKKLQKYDWPGNIRELQHSIERAVIMSDGNTLKSSDFDFIDSKDVTSNPFDDYNIEKLEKWAIENCLKKHKGNISKASLELGLTRGALYRRIEKYGI